MSVLIFIGILLVLIVGHEFGHLIAAKLSKMKVPEFGIGFPPRIWGRHFGGTEYTINALPFGGFVRIVGEDGQNGDDPQAFSRRPKILQAVTLMAGPGMNIVLAFFAFFFAFMIGVPAATDTSRQLENQRVIVASVLAKSPAALAGIQQGDTVVAITTPIARIEITDPKQIADALKDTDKTVIVTVRRGASEQEVSVMPITGLIKEDPERHGIGIATASIGTATYDAWGALIEAGKSTWSGLIAVTLGLLGLIGGAFTLSASIHDISGPVGIASIVGDAAAIGAGQVLLIAAIISLNLAVINLLPFPALDGGRLALLVIEALRGKPLKQRIVESINVIGFFVLIGLMLVVTWNDIARLVG